jgi:DNA (cytosine-5)-methyltransferase 3A
LELPKSKTRRGRVSVGKTNTLNTACNYGVVVDNNLRELNILEYERLQTIPDNYTNAEGVSINQRKRMIGNGWTVDVISHIFKNIV